MNSTTKNKRNARINQSNLKNNKGITLIALIAIIVMILTIAFSTIYFIFYKGEEELEVEEFVQGGITVTPEKIAGIEDLEMDTRIVSNITEESVPIPSGYTYVQGDKNTGIIIKSNESEINYLFIPYDENASIETEEYYKKVDYISMDSLTLNSIKKYNGFFVELNSNFEMEHLKTIDKDNYEFQYEQLKYAFDNNDSINVHMLYKEEIAQINYYLKNNNIDLGENTIGIQSLIIEPFSKINPDELVLSNETTNTVDLSRVSTRNTEVLRTSNVNLTKVATTKTSATKNSNKNYVYLYKTKSELYGGSSKSKVEIPIPSGFNYCEIDGIIMIQDSSNENLIYIWVPLKYENLDNVKSQLWKNIYKKYKNENGETFSTDTELYDMIKDSEESSITKFKESIKEYNGFYISQAELSKNKDKEYVNTSRGMIDYSVSGTTGGGDYLRGSNLKTKIYSKMEADAKESNENVSVTGHLMYGVEYDATVLWIAETNRDYKDKQGRDIYNILCANSTNVGKYSNSGLGPNASASEVESFNGIWGLGGNLSEVTQELYEKKYITRGGSYADTGEHAPIASRNATKDLNKNNIGFRTALYIDPDLKTTKTKNDTFKHNPSDDTIEEINGIEFKLMGNATRFVNDWNGVNVYKNPNETATVIKTLSMAEEIIVNAKAVKEITRSNGTKLVWARIKLSDKEKDYGYINAQQLTDSITFFTDGKNNIGFVMTEKEVIRYYKDGLSVYSYPNDENLLFTTAYSGQLEIVGKSTNQKWALYKVGEEERFVHSKDLTINVEKETSSNNIEFIKGNQKKFWTIENDVKLYSQPQENSEIKTLEYGTEAIVTAISIDGVWSKVKVDSNITSYILSSKLTAVEPSAEQKAEKGGTFTVTNDVVYVTASAVNVRSSCDTNDTNIIKTISYRSSVNRIATGNNGWDKVSIDGQTAYIYNKYLSKTQPAPIENTAKSNTTQTSSNSNNSTSNNNTSNKPTISGDGSVIRPVYVTVTATLGEVTMSGRKVWVTVKANNKVGSIKTITRTNSITKKTNSIKFTKTVRQNYIYADGSYITRDRGIDTISATTTKGLGAGAALSAYINLPYYNYDSFKGTNFIK